MSATPEPIRQTPILWDHWKAMPASVSQGTAWHYTSAAGLMGIVHSDEIWASSPRVMNDLREVTFGSDRVKTVWAEMNKSDMPDAGVTLLEMMMRRDLETPALNKRYAACASFEKDNLLTQWMNYAHEDGFAIGLDLARDWHTVHAPEELSSYPRLEGWFHVVYNLDKQRQVVERWLTWIATHTTEGIMHPKYADEWADYCADVVAPLLLQLKHPAFEQEHEVRYLTYRRKEDKPSFRPSGGRVVPYMTAVTTPPPPWPGISGHPKLPIVGVRCAPTTRPGTKEIVAQLLTASGHWNAEVTTSEIPLAR